MTAAASPPPQPRLTLAVIGLGSIGGVAAGCLGALGRHEVIACVRKPMTTLTLEQPGGTVEMPLRALIDPAQAEAFLTKYCHEIANNAVEAYWKLGEDFWSKYNNLF